MEEIKEEVEVVEVKENWFSKTKNKFKDFCKQHPEAVFSVIGGIASLLGGAMKFIAYDHEYESEVYVTDGEDVYKVPAKQMKSKKTVKLRKRR